MGKIAEEQLFEIQKRFKQINIEKFVVMPNHIHFIISILNESGCSVALSDIVGAYKSLVTKNAREICSMNKIFQTSFYDRVIRDEKEYKKVFDYIEHNPSNWLFDRYNSDYQ